MMYDDDETQGLVKYNQNPQDPPSQGGFNKQITSYSDWSNYDKPATNTQDSDGVKKRMFVYMFVALLVVYSGYHMLYQSQQLRIVEEPKTNSNANKSASSALSKLAAATQAARTDVEDDRLQLEFEQRLQAEKDLEESIAKRRAKDVNDAETIDQLLNHYITKAVSPNVDEEVEKKLLEQQELNIEPTTIIKLEELEISDDENLGIVDEIEPVDRSAEIEEQLKQTEIILPPEEQLVIAEAIKEQEEQREDEVVPEPPKPVIVKPTQTFEVPEKLIYESLQSYLVEEYDDADDQYIQRYEDIPKPLSSTKNYRLLILANGIKVLLIQDPEDQTFYDLGLSLRNGAWDDPADKPGLSNLMLHMLVEGIPVDDCGSLFDCMQRSGGIAEGFTEDVFSNFELEATDIYTFEKSLNNFLGILGKPTLNRLKVVEQAKEIEGEDTITLVGDNWKLQDIIKILAKPEHPISHKQSLWMADKQSYVPNVLLRHYDDHFSSNLISVVLRSDQGLEDLEQIIMQSSLKLIKNRRIITKDYDQNGTLNQLFRDLPFVGENILFKFHVVWHDFGLKLLVQLGKHSQYNDFFQYLMMQTGEGSLGHILAQMNYATENLSFNGLTFAETYHFSTITFDIGSQLEDLERVFLVLQVFTSYIEFLKTEDLIEQYRQFTRYSNMKFSFDDPTEEENILLLAQKLHFNEYHFLLRDEVKAYDDASFKEYLDQYISNYIVLIGRKDFKYQAQSFAKKSNLEYLTQQTLQSHNEEFRLDYSMQTIEHDNLKAIREPVKVTFKLQDILDVLPINYEYLNVCNTIERSLEVVDDETVRYFSLDKNAFEKTLEGSEAQVSDPVLREATIEQQHLLPAVFQRSTPELCNLRERSASIQTVPFALNTSLWWKPSHLRKAPQVFLGLFVQRPEQSTVERSKTLVKVYQKYLQEIFRQHMQVELTELDYEVAQWQQNHQVHIENHINGLNLQTYGWSDTQPRLMKKAGDILTGQLKPKQPEQQLFEEVKEQLSTDIKQFYSQKLSTLTLQYYFPFIMLRPVHTPEQIQATLQEVTYKDFQEYTQQLFQSPENVEIAYFGNILPDTAQSFANDLLKELGLTQRQGKVYWTKTLNIRGNSLVYPVLGKSDDSSVMNFYQLGIRNVEQLSMLQFIAAYLQQSNQDLLVKIKSVGCIDGLSIYSQSQESPAQMNQQIEDYLVAQEQQLNSISADVFNDFKWELINRMQQEKYFQSIQEEGLFIWERILNKSYAFNELSEMLHALEALTQSQVTEFFARIFRGDLHGKMSVQVYGQTVAASWTTEDEFKLTALDGALKSVNAHIVIVQGQTIAQQKEEVVFNLEDVIKVNKNYYECFYNLNN